MTHLRRHDGRIFTLRETVMVAFGMAMIVVLVGHLLSWLVGHAFAPATLAYTEIGLGAVARVTNRILGGA